MPDWRFSDIPVRVGEAAIASWHAQHRDADWDALARPRPGRLEQRRVHRAERRVLRRRPAPRRGRAASGVFRRRARAVRPPAVGARYRVPAPRLGGGVSHPLWDHHHLFGAGRRARRAGRLPRGRRGQRAEPASDRGAVPPRGRSLRRAHRLRRRSRAEARTARVGGRRAGTTRLISVGRRSRRRGQRESAPDTSTTDYRDAEGNVLTLRDALSDGTLRQLAQLDAKPAASAEDRWQRRVELLFERLTVRWEIAGLPLDSQKELLGRYRMASGDERRWVRETLTEHLRTRHPDVTV